MVQTEVGGACGVVGDRSREGGGQGEHAEHLGAGF